MNNFCEVSVVIPCYNSELFILRAVESVYSQKLKPKELIIVDDCSTDNTKDIINNLKKRYEDGWIRVIFLHKNKGPGFARNAGWNLATQKYIAFLDSDDLWHPLKLKIQFDLLEKNKNITIIGNKLIGCEALNHRKNEIFLKKVTLNSQLFRNRFATSSVVCKKSLPFRFDTTKKESEDFLLWCNIIASEDSAYTTNCALSCSFKFAYGDSGLTKNLFKMELGALKSFHSLYINKTIGVASFSFFSLFEFSKFIIRIFITIKRKLLNEV
jgi:glycosyltransferase involved in cell wall biosynthesis